ncbi:MAG: hypothetical protein HY849_05535 [Nitrosomonadales bacterium]|nr:hypothetical protein [Nitrosomonadales bacterium]
MQIEFDSLERKLAQLTDLTARLRAENLRLRQELASAHSQNRQYSDKIDAVTGRLEDLLTQLPEQP